MRKKLKKISDLVSINGITEIDGWNTITPDSNYDWINQRNNDVTSYIILGDKSKEPELSIFDTYSIGILSNRDPWIFNYSTSNLNNNLKRMIDVFNAHSTKLVGVEKSKIADLIDLNPKNIKWTTDLYSKISKGEIQNLDSEKVETCLYRPFTKVKFYNNSTWNWSRHLIPKYYPTYSLKNICIVTTGTGSSKDFSVMVSNVITEKQFLSNGQCFPLYIYEENTVENKDADLFTQVKSSTANGKYTRKDAIGDAGLKYFQDTYPNETINKEDIFYYVYGLLHSEDYRTRYADNLTKELPRIPSVKKAEDFGYSLKRGVIWHIGT